MKKYISLLALTMFCGFISAFAQNTNIDASGVDLSQYTTTSTSTEVDASQIPEGLDIGSILSDPSQLDSILEDYGITQDQIDEYFESEGVESGDYDALMDKYLEKYDGDVEKLLTEEFGLPADTLDSLVELNTTVGDFIGPVNTAFDETAKVFLNVVPNMATMVNVYPDAWIGSLIGLPPHFAGGINFGATALYVEPIQTLLGPDGLNVVDLSDILANTNGNLLLPTIAADLRIGGIILPFDFGVGLNILNKSMLDQIGEMASVSDYTQMLYVDFLTVNGDFRYALLKEGIVRPAISVGGGYTYLKGEIGAHVKNGNNENVAGLGFAYQTHLAYIQAQVSKKILFITPFAGVKFATDFTKVDWNYGIEGEIGSFIEAYNNMVEKAGKSEYSIPLAYSGTVQNHMFSRVIPQVYGGFGISLFVIKLNTVIGYDFYNQLPSAAFSLRVQI